MRLSRVGACCNSLEHTLVVEGMDNRQSAGGCSGRLGSQTAQLATSCLNAVAFTLSKQNIDSALDKNLAKAMNGICRWCLVRQAIDGVVRNYIQHAGLSAEQFHKLAGACRCVIDSAEQDVFKRQSPAGCIKVVISGS